MDPTMRAELCQRVRVDYLCRMYYGSAGSLRKFKKDFSVDHGIEKDDLENIICCACALRVT